MLRERNLQNEWCLKLVDMNEERVVGFSQYMSVVWKSQSKGTTF